MDIIKSIDEINNSNRSVVTIGKFDGVHKGHQVLIKKTVEYAKENNMKSVVFTFKNHPANYFHPNHIKDILTNEEKINMFSDLGIDMVVIVPFDEKMTKISANDFVKSILMDRLNAEKIIIGHDFSFARNKEGNPEVLKTLSKKYNFEVEVVEPIKINDIRVSSSYIRKLILDGDLDKVRTYLGYNYKILGKVIYSKQLGRKLGFPTANLEVKPDILIPKKGIYTTKVYIDDEVYFGATNIGYNPTVKGTKLSIETHILQFNRDIYGKCIQLEFLERLRDEKKFSSIEELKNQLEFDTNYIYKNYVCKNDSYVIK